MCETCEETYNVLRLQPRNLTCTSGSKKCQKIDLYLIQFLIGNHDEKPIHNLPPPNPLNTKALLIAHFMYCSQIYPKKYRSKINLYSHICSSIYSILGCYKAFSAATYEFSQ